MCPCRHCVPSFKSNGRAAAAVTPTWQAKPAAGTADCGGRMRAEPLLLLLLPPLLAKAAAAGPLAARRVAPPAPAVLRAIKPAQQTQQPEAGRNFRNITHKTQHQCEQQWAADLLGLDNVPPLSPSYDLNPKP